MTPMDPDDSDEAGADREPPEPAQSGDHGTGPPTEILARQVPDPSPMAPNLRAASPPRQYHVAAPLLPTAPPAQLAQAEAVDVSAPPASPVAGGASRGSSVRAGRAAAAYVGTAAPVAAPAPHGPGATGGGSGDRPPPRRGRRAGRGPGVPKPKPKWFRPKLRWLFVYLPLLIVLALLAAGGWVYLKVQDLGRVDVGNSLTPATGTALNYLLVGSDSRDGVDPTADDTGTIGDAKGQRSDTIIVLRVDGASATMMSIPRDLWVENPETGRQGRINGTYNSGPANLITAVTRNLGIPIQHYVEVDFTSFAGMVDAVGGVTIDFPHPASDRKSGLRVDQAGPNVLDGSQALAYVRSRTYTEIIDGKPRTDPTADLGRQERQQTFIRTVLKEVGETRNPVELAKVAGAAATGTRVDPDLGVGDLWRLARNLGAADPVTVVLPTSGAVKGGASVLELRRAEAAPVLAQFGAR